MKLTPGKLQGMKRVSNEHGVIAAAAMDQRGSLKKALGTRATDEGLTEFKSYVTEVLTQHASAILLDPEWGLQPSKRRAKGSGLLLAYEKTGYDAKLSGRLPDLLEVWSVRRLKEAGADCIKILLYYSPFDDAKINDHKHAWTERIGDECRANDIPFFLELIGYKEGLEDKGPEFAALKPKVVADSMREFSKDRYGVDVLKVEIPVNLQYVEGAKSFKGPKVFTKTEALQHYRNAAQATKKPFIYLSAGVGNAQFVESLNMAAEAGTDYSGVLCGRATWKDGIPIYAEKGGKAFEAWLKDEGVKNIENVNNALKAATPWYSIYEVAEPALATK